MWTSAVAKRKETAADCTVFRGTLLDLGRGTVCLFSMFSVAAIHRLVQLNSSIKTPGVFVDRCVTLDKPCTAADRPLCQKT